METAKIEGPKALMRVSYELVKHPIIGRMVATQIRLIDEERQGFSNNGTFRHRVA